MRYVFEEGKTPQLFDTANQTPADKFVEGSFMFVDEPVVKTANWAVREQNAQYHQAVFRCSWRFIDITEVPPHLQAALLLIRRNVCR